MDDGHKFDDNLLELYSVSMEYLCALREAPPRPTQVEPLCRLLDLGLSMSRLSMSRLRWYHEGDHPEVWCLIEPPGLVERVASTEL